VGILVQSKGGIGMNRYVFTITTEMVNNPGGLSASQWHKLTQCMGKLQPIDIGKRVYDCGDFYQVENNEQRDKRVAKA
jgi:hypothetical protein